MNQDLTSTRPVNRSAIVSVIAALLTLLSFCIAVAPIPLTGYICYPGAALLGVIALVTGIVSLVQIRSTRQDGRIYAIIGTLIGTAVLLASLCAIGSGLLLLPRLVDLLRPYFK